MAALDLDGIGKRFGAVEVLKDIDLHIEDGELCVFVGPSGCGKSTLLRIIAGLEDTSCGTLSIGGRKVNGLSPKERGIAMVFQSYALYPHRTVRGNMEFGLRLSRMKRAEIDARVARAAKMLQIEPLLDRRPAQLSGGQRQRVAIGRAVVREPEVFLFDEPLSNLDAALRVSTRREIADLHRELRATMIYVTHDQVEAMTLADRIVVIDGGRIQQVGRPLELYRTPANVFVARFIGSPRMNILPATVAEARPGSALVTSEALGQIAVSQRNGIDAGAKVWIGIRPEAVSIAEQGGIAGEIAMVEHLGDAVLAEIRFAAGDEVMSIKCPATRDLELGDAVRFSIDPSTIHLFDDSGARL